jgi:PAS domain-containing protein
MPAGVAAHHDNYLQNYLRTGMKKMMGTQRETTAQRKDKSTFPCVLGLSQTKNSHLFCGFIRDVTMEKQALSEIVESKMLMETILDASFDALFVINDRGIIQKVNAASARVFGWTVDELVGKNINIIMPEERAKKHDSYLESEFSTLLFCCFIAHHSQYW